jgi:hypothetical protein
MRPLVAALAFAVAACGAAGGGGPDLAAPMTAAPDLATPGTSCDPVDNFNDGTPCSNGCPAGQALVNVGGACRCYYSCDASNQASCPCDRLCDTLSRPEAGVVGAACLPGNAAGTRCGYGTTGAPIGNGICAQGLSCVSDDPQRQTRYCMYLCATQADCPAQTACRPLLDPATGAQIGSVCALAQGGPAAKGLGQPCVIGSDTCDLGLLCDGSTCKPQCDGPSGSCPSGVCSPISDGGRVVAFVCE